MSNKIIKSCLYMSVALLAIGGISLIFTSYGGELIMLSLLLAVVPFCVYVVGTLEL